MSQHGKEVLETVMGEDFECYPRMGEEEATVWLYAEYLVVTEYWIMAGAADVVYSEES